LDDFWTIIVSGCKHSSEIREASIWIGSVPDIAITGKSSVQSCHTDHI